MISKETTSEVSAVIDAWCACHEIPKDKVIDLLQRLSLVKGNQSYRMSIRALVLMLKEPLQESCPECGAKPGLHYLTCSRGL